MELLSTNRFDSIQVGSRLNIRCPLQPCLCPLKLWKGCVFSYYVCINVHLHSIYFSEGLADLIPYEDKLKLISASKYCTDGGWVIPHEELSGGRTSGLETRCLRTQKMRLIT